MQFDRRNTTLIGRWWWTVDRTSWFMLLFLMCLGGVMVAAASPPVAERIGLDPFYFISRHQVFVVLGAAVLFFVSTMTAQQVRRLAVFLFLGMLALLILLPFIGYEVKGATRWIRLAGFSLQPSEFMKPAFAVVVAWIFAEKYRVPGFPGFRIALALYALVIALLILQPDFGMVVTMSSVFAIQFFLAGIPFLWVVVMLLAGMGGVMAAYNLLPHVTRRIDRFLDPSSGDNYQVEKSLEAFGNGGLFGRGPGEGQVKSMIPDSHTDFIFAVAGEEFGALVCLMIIGLFSVIVIRGFIRLMEEKDLFISLAATGLLAQFAIQSIINMGVAVNLLPAKGMTLPFVSYGGSSMLAMSLGMGMFLSLTRKRYGECSANMRAA